MSSFFAPARSGRRALVALLLVALVPLAAASEAVYHVVEKGETLYSVARAYGIKPAELAAANSLDLSTKLRIGAKLLIPRVAGSAAAAEAADSSSGSAGALQCKTHKVAKGQTLFSIAKSYGVSVDSLRGANGLGPSSVLKVGMTLKVPVEARGGASVGAAGPNAAPPAAAPSSDAKPSSGAKPSAAPAPAQPASAPASDGPSAPDPVKTSAKAVSKDVSWPCPGELLYLDGKAYGVIIKTKLGEAEKAVAPGVVSSAGLYRGYGNVVFVLSKTGHIYVYGGNESLSVKAGDHIKSGQELGRVGLDVKQGGPVAYFLVFKNGAAVDPAQAPRE